jgi:hypothetical protein
MNKKLTIYSIALSLVVLSVAGLAFAHWTKVITVSGVVTTGSVSWEWSTQAGQSVDDGDPGDYLRDLVTWDIILDNPKDIGWAEMLKTEDPDTLLVNIYNAYPGYTLEVTTHIHYTGSVPGIVKSVLIYDADTDELLATIDHPDTYDIEIPDGEYPFAIDWYETFGQLHYCNTWEASFFITFLEDLVQDEVSEDLDPNYSLRICFEIINYNEYRSQHPKDPFEPIG